MRRIEDELLARLIEGRLSAPEREEVLARLVRSQDDLEVFTDTSEILAAEGSCACCGSRVQALTLTHAPSLGGPVCQVCWKVADKVVKQFRADALRAWGELRDQLRGIVIDVRAGADVPTFYRGLD